MAAPSTLHPCAIDWAGVEVSLLPSKYRGERRHIREDKKRRRIEDKRRSENRREKKEETENKRKKREGRERDITEERIE